METEGYRRVKEGEMKVVGKLNFLAKDVPGGEGDVGDGAHQRFVVGTANADIVVGPAEHEGLSGWVAR